MTIQRRARRVCHEFSRYTVLQLYQIRTTIKHYTTALYRLYEYVTERVYERTTHESAATFARSVCHVSPRLHCCGYVCATQHLDRSTYSFVGQLARSTTLHHHTDNSTYVPARTINTRAQRSYNMHPGRLPSRAINLL